jgi:acetyl-CoA carboxylase biotin carboxyl carrier protein
MTRRAEQAAESIKGSPAPWPDRTEPFTLEEVKALVNALEGTDVSSLRWNRNGQQIVIRRGRAAPITVVHGGPAAASALAQVPALAPSAIPVATAPAPVHDPKPEAKPGVIVKTPFVGTFYRAPSPDSPPFVDVGTVVKKGQVLCIVEAMKLMNELEAEVPGRIAEIFVGNATMVELGHPLFRIEPA